MNFEQWYAANFPDGNAGGDGSEHEQTCAKEAAREAWDEGSRLARKADTECVSAIRYNRLSVTATKGLSRETRESLRDAFDQVLLTLPALPPV